jgi:hypothetical protein
MWHVVALVRNDASEERAAPIIIFLRSVFRLLVTANVVPRSPILINLMMEAIRSFEISALKELHRVTSQKTAMTQPHNHYVK